MHTLKPQKPKKPPLVDLQNHPLRASVRMRGSRVTQKTLDQDQYHRQIAGFHTRARRQKLRVNKGNLDAMVVKYMAYMHEREGAEPSVGSYLIYGLQLLQCDIPKALSLPNAKGNFGQLAEVEAWVYAAASSGGADLRCGGTAVSVKVGLHVPSPAAL